MILPVKTLRKKDLEWLGTNKCRHHMTYLSHYQCFLEEKPSTAPFAEKVGYFDIETTGFYADYCFMLSYCILDDDDKLIKNIITAKEIHKYEFDRRLLSDLCKDLRGFDRIVVYYGSDYKFDIPFSRTRAIKHGLDFPLYKDILVTDAYAIVKAKLRMSRRGLLNTCDLFEIPVKEHPGKPNVWMRAAAGKQEDLDYVLIHNIEDVKSLRELYHKIIGCTTKGRRSI